MIVVLDSTSDDILHKLRHYSDLYDCYALDSQSIFEYVSCGYCYFGDVFILNTHIQVCYPTTDDAAEHYRLICKFHTDQRKLLIEDILL